MPARRLISFWRVPGIQTPQAACPRTVHSNRFARNLWQTRALQSFDMLSTEHMTPAIPRPSASLIVLNAKNEVLMVQRHSDSHSFAGAHVFPGGNYDKLQDNSLEMTAIRETFEETGILLASRMPGSLLPENTYNEARRAIHSGKLLFTDFLSENGLVADADSLLPFSTWVTPSHAPSRFRAQFFVTFLPVASAVSGPSSGRHIHRLPSPDSPDGDASSSTEVVSAQFVHPRDTIATFARGEIGLMPPQFYILSTLIDIFESSPDANTNTPIQREQIARISRSAFGSMEFNPRYLFGAPRASPDGSQFLVLEGDETSGGKKGHMHRMKFLPQKGTVLPRTLELICNFDISKDFEGGSPPASKL